jgi:protein dithiol:quinone oxidoreductase
MRYTADRSGRWLVAIAGLSLLAVGAALVSQHVYGMDPCPWCILQRVIFVAIALACLIGLASRRVAAGVVTLLALSGVAAAVWQHFVAASSTSCVLTLADRIVIALKLDSLLPDVFLARASCADAAVNLFGIPYDFYSLALFALIAAAGVLLLRRPR